MKKLVGLLCLMAFCFIACRNASKPATVRQFTDQQLTAKFPEDLGPDQIDVSSYPPRQQANYTLFSQKCSQCHTLARPINSPMTSEKDWTRYVTRMHGKAEDRFQEKLLNGAEAKKVIGFLAFDSRERKVKHAQEFQAQTAKLDDLFKAVQAERSQVQAQQGREKANEPAPYTGDKPSSR